MAEHRVQACRVSRTKRVMMCAGLGWGLADVPRQGQDEGGDATQGEGQDENPAHRPAAGDSRRGAVSTACQPASLQDAVP